MLSLEDEGLDAVLKTDDTVISRDDGVDAITNRLNRLFKKGSTITKYQVLEAFETFKRPSNMSIQVFLNKSDNRLFKTKSFGAMSDYILAYRMLKAANLSNYHEDLTKATISDLQHDLMKDQLKILRVVLLSTKTSKNTCCLGGCKVLMPYILKNEE